MYKVVKSAMRSESSQGWRSFSKISTRTSLMTERQGSKIGVSNLSVNDKSGTFVLVQVFRRVINDLITRP